MRQKDLRNTLNLLEDKSKFFGKTFQKMSASPATQNKAELFRHSFIDSFIDGFVPSSRPAQTRSSDIMYVSSDPKGVNRNCSSTGVAREHDDAISSSTVSRCKQNARACSRSLLAATIHRGEYLARAIRKQNTRRASPDKRIPPRFPFLRRALACEFSSGRRKYLAYFCWELIRTVIPASGCALKILSTNNPRSLTPTARSPRC